MQMAEQATAVWEFGMRFSGHSGSGHQVAMDGVFEHSQGARPKELILVALTGCTGMDVASIMEKMGKALSHFEMAADGDVAESHPRVFTAIRLSYRGTGDPGAEANFIRAAELSFTKYCPVAAMLKQVARVSYEVYWNDRLVASAPSA